MTSQVRRQVLSGLAVFVTLTQTTCFRFGPAGPATEDVTLTLVTGDGQLGPPSQFLIDSLTVAVRTRDGDLPADGVLVDWEIAVGPVSGQLAPLTSPSDSAGLVRARLRLGSELGRYVVRASIRDRPEESVDFEAWAVLPPTLAALSSTALNAGDVITLTGTNFSSIAAHNVVLFSGIPGRVVAGDVVRLDVIVPPCLPTRSVGVSVQLGGEASTSLPLSVTASAGALNLALGADTVLLVDDTPACLKVGSGGPQEYLAVVQSTATIGAARFDYMLTGLRPPAPMPVAFGLDRAPRNRTENTASRVGTPRGLTEWEGDTITVGGRSLNTAQAPMGLFSTGARGGTSGRRFHGGEGRPNYSWSGPGYWRAQGFRRFSSRRRIRSGHR